MCISIAIYEGVRLLMSSKVLGDCTLGGKRCITLKELPISSEQLKKRNSNDVVNKIKLAIQLVIIAINGKKLF